MVELRIILKNERMKKALSILREVTVPAAIHAGPA
jgi:hypothetical protein